MTVIIIIIYVHKPCDHYSVQYRNVHEWMDTVLLEYFAGEKPLRMSKISRKVDPLRSNYCVLAMIVCIY